MANIFDQLRFNAQSPLEPRTVVGADQVFTTRANIPSIEVYRGLIVYDENNNVLYRYDGDSGTNNPGDWLSVDLQTYYTYTETNPVDTSDPSNMGLENNLITFENNLNGISRGDVFIISSTNNGARDYITLVASVVSGNVLGYTLLDGGNLDAAVVTTLRAVGFDVLFSVNQTVEGMVFSGDGVVVEDAGSGRNIINISIEGLTPAEKEAVVELEDHFEFGTNEVRIDEDELYIGGEQVATRNYVLTHGVVSGFTDRIQFNADLVNPGTTITQGSFTDSGTDYVTFEFQAQHGINLSNLALVINTGANEELIPSSSIFTSDIGSQSLGVTGSTTDGVYNDYTVAITQATFDALTTPPAGSSPYPTSSVNARIARVNFVEEVVFVNHEAVATRHWVRDTVAGFTEDLDFMRSGYINAWVAGTLASDMVEGERRETYTDIPGFDGITWYFFPDLNNGTWSRQSLPSTTAADDSTFTI